MMHFTENGRKRKEEILLLRDEAGSGQSIIVHPEGMKQLPACFAISECSRKVTEHIRLENGILTVRCGQETIKITVINITNGIISNDYMELFMNDKTHKVIHCTMVAFLDLVGIIDFFQNSRSEFIAFSFIDSIPAGKGGKAMDKNKKEHEISKTRKVDMDYWFANHI